MKYAVFYCGTFAGLWVTAASEQDARDSGASFLDCPVDEITVELVQ